MKRTAFLRFLGAHVAPPRFLLFLAALAALAPWLHHRGYAWSSAFILGFDAAALLFLLVCAPLLRTTDAASLRRHAADNDANRPVLLVVTSVVMVAILTALVALLPHASSAGGKLLIVATLAIAWLFSNSIYALHYAHLYYRRSGGEGGLRFAGKTPPDYSDFVYFAFTLGMTFQTSDTEVETREFRRAVTLHSLAAFLFNLGVVAFAINVLGSH